MLKELLGHEIQELIKAKNYNNLKEAISGGGTDSCNIMH